MFCFMELDLISLKVSAVSSSRFWVVYGFSLSWEVLVLAVLDMSISIATIKVALSAYLSLLPAPLLVPGIFAGSSVPQSFSALQAKTC